MKWDYIALALWTVTVASTDVLAQRGPGALTGAGSRRSATSAVPRQLLPMSLSDVTVRRPTLHWELPAEVDGAQIELCRDRACTQVIETLRVVGTSARPTAALAPRTVVFWRLRPMRGGSVVGTAMSATWLFHVPAVDASTGVDSSRHPHLDVNGDGFDDVVVGAPNTAVRDVAEVGVARVFHGSPTGVSEAAALELQGSPAVKGFGDVVASAGDVNGDGFGDVLISASKNARLQENRSGVVWVYLGSARGLNAARTIELRRGIAGDDFGHSAACAGDMNGDGYAEVVVGAPRVSASRVMLSGSASVFWGSATGPSRTRAAHVDGTTSIMTLGRSVAGIGDVNGDGLSDIVVGASMARCTQGSACGQVMVIQGSAQLGVRAAQPLVATRTILGTEPLHRLGEVVSSAGDVNGDGLSDLMVGSFNDGGVIGPGPHPVVGEVRLYLGSTTGVGAEASSVMTVAAPGEKFCGQLSPAGDVNGDGFGDIVVGSRCSGPMGEGSGAGYARVHLGGASGVAANFAVQYDGVSGLDWFANALSGAGDVNGDGFCDVIVGAPIAGAGYARIYLGSAATLSSTPAVVLRGARSDQSFGWSVGM